MAPACPHCGYQLVVRAVTPASANAASPAGPRALSAQDQMLIEQRVTNEGPSAGVAYLLWFFLGLFGAHRFYVGSAGTGVAQLILTISGIGLVISAPWVLIDAFLIPEMLQRKRAALRQQMSAIVSGGVPANPHTNSPSYYDPNAPR
jgi:TM2 domain-containing membrane protein YozV